MTYFLTIKISFDFSCIQGCLASLWVGEEVLWNCDARVEHFVKFFVRSYITPSASYTYYTLCAHMKQVRGQGYLWICRACIGSRIASHLYAFCLPFSSFLDVLFFLSPQ